MILHARPETSSWRVHTFYRRRRRQSYPRTLAAPSPNRERLGRSSIAVLWPPLLCCVIPDTRNGACRNEADFDIAPESDYEFARQSDQHNAANARRLTGRSLLIPLGESAIGLIFSPKPCDLNHNASREYCQLSRYPGNGSLIRCRRRSASSRDRSPIAADWRNDG